jgi:prevent-host-death family protein
MEMGDRRRERDAASELRIAGVALLLHCDSMKTIPQRTLRNDSARILREAEAGEQFVITVHGRAVAFLGPYERRQWVTADSVRELFATPTDPDLLEDLRRHEPAEIVDPWER